LTLATVEMAVSFCDESQQLEPKCLPLIKKGRQDVRGTMHHIGLIGMIIYYGQALRERLL